MKKIFSLLLCFLLIVVTSLTVSAKTSLGFDYGDVNIDGTINMKDALSLKKHIAQWNNTDYNREASDTNGDDTVDVKDLLQLQNYLTNSINTMGPEMTARIALCDGVSAVAEGDGTNVSFITNSTYGTVITFSGNGTYYLSGTMTGRLVIAYPSKNDDDKITLVLNGVNITCNANCPIWVDKAEKTVITTINKTDNYLTDNSSTVTGSKNACIYADDDLTINGKGNLKINATGKNGVKCENDLKITNGNIEINAGNNGIVGETSVTYKDAETYIYCSGDGIKTTDEEDTDKGFILISSGELHVSCADDVLQATRSITVSGCSIYYKFNADDITTCHKTKVGTTEANGNSVIVGTENVAEGSFVEWTE